MTDRVLPGDEAVLLLDTDRVVYESVGVWMRGTQIS